MSIARRVLPSRLELNSPAGSASDAPFANVNFTTFLYVSPVQIMPPCDHTGTPCIEFDGFRHFTSSTTRGSACLMSFRTPASIWLRQSLSSSFLASINGDRGSTRFSSFDSLFLFLTAALVLFMVVVARCLFDYRLIVTHKRGAAPVSTFTYRGGLSELG